MINEHFINRRQELSHLHNLFVRTLDGSFLVVFVPGEAGSGKTSLIEKFIEQTRRRVPRVVVARGSCSSQNRLLAFDPFIQIVTDLYDATSRKNVGTSSDKNERRKQLAEFVKEVAPAWLDLFTGGIASAIKTTYEESRKWVDQPVTQSRVLSQQNVFEQFVNTIIELQMNRPLIIFLDDLHWMDDSSLDLLFYLFRSLSKSPVFLIATYRPIDSQLENSRFEHVRNEIIRYGGLDFPYLESHIDVQEYVNSRYSVNQFDILFLKKIQEHTGGQPLFVRQLFDWLEETGRIVRQVGINGVCWTTGGEEEERIAQYIPDSTLAVIANRLNRLEEYLKQILTYASVEGEDFTLQVLAQLRHMDELRLFEDVNILEHRYRVIAELEERTLSLNTILSLYRFTHRLFREYLYASLGEAQKRLLHHRIGECLESLYREDAYQIADRLVIHFQKSRQYDKASHYAWISAVNSYEKFGWQETITWSNTALELLQGVREPKKEILVQIHLLMSKCYGSIGEFQNRINAILQAELLVDAANRFTVDLELSDYYYSVSQFDLALQHVESAIYNTNIPPIMMAMAYSKYAEILAYLGQHKQALLQLEKMLEIGNLLNNESISALAYDGLSWSWYYLGEMSQTTEAAQKAFSLYKKIDDRYGLAYSLRVLAYVFENLGDLEKALQNRMQAFEFSSGINDRFGTFWTQLEIGDSYLWLGEFEKARSYYLISLQSAEKLDQDSYLGYVYEGLGKLEIECGNLESARQYLQETLAIRTEQNDRLWVGETLCYLSIVDCLLDRVDGSLEAAEKAVAIFADFDDKLHRPLALYALGLSQAANDQVEMAKESFGTALRISKEISSILWQSKIEDELSKLRSL